MSTTPPRGGRRESDFPPWAAQVVPALDPHDVRAPALYVNEDDSLVVSIVNALAGVDVVIRLRTIALDGRIVPQDFTVTPTSNRAQFSQLIHLQECFLAGVAVILGAGSPRRGQTFVTLALGRGPATAPIPLHTLLADYLVAGTALGWPCAFIRQPTEGPGLLRSIAGTNPAAGVEISEAVPTGARWRLRSLRAQLVASGVAANRRVHVVVDDGATVLFELAAADLVTAGLTRNFNCTADGYARATQDNEIYVPLPLDVMMLQGWRVRTLTTAIDAGDNWGAPQLNVEEWIEA